MRKSLTLIFMFAILLTACKQKPANIITDEIVIETEETISTNNKMVQTEEVQQQKPSQTQQVQEQKKVKEFAVKEVKTQVMYVNATTNSYKGPNSIDFEKMAEYFENDGVTVNGLVNKYGNETVLWYQTENGDFIDGNYLSLEPIETYIEEPVYGESESLDERIQNNPDLQKIAEDIAREIYGSNSGGNGQVHQVPQEVLDALGATPDQTKSDGKHFGQTEAPDYLKGEITLE